jgi:hypothetical protein
MLRAACQDSRLMVNASHRSWSIGDQNVDSTPSAYYFVNAAANARRHRDPRTFGGEGAC